MTPRERRLLSDLAQMEELARTAPVSFRTEGAPPDVYHLMLSVPGVAVQGGSLALRSMHRCDAYLHRDYPRRPPVVTWLTPVWHPNLLGPDRNGGVCIGQWSAAESLADLTCRLVELVAWRTFNLDDPLDRDAAAWARAHGVAAGAAPARLAALPLVDRPSFTVTRSHA